MKELIKYIKSVKLPHVNDIKRLYLSKEVKAVLEAYNFTLLELIYRIKRDIPLDKIFTCAQCNKPVKFKYHRYFKFCCHKCALNYGHNSKERNVKISKTHKQKFVKRNSNILKKYNLTYAEYIYRIHNNIPLDKIIVCKECGNKIKFKYHRYEDFCSYKCANTHIPSIKLRVESGYNTKKINSTFNTSKFEEKTYQLFLTKFSKDDIKRQYKSKLYPFACDFYIKSLDLYIETNGHWSHGWDHKKCLGPFNSNNPEHIKLLNKWKSKDTKYYRNAIKVWTINDILKYKTAKQNKLNYKVFWNLNEVEYWLNSL